MACGGSYDVSDLTHKYGQTYGCSELGQEFCLFPVDKYEF